MAAALLAALLAVAWQAVAGGSPGSAGSLAGLWVFGALCAGAGALWARLAARPPLAQAREQGRALQALAPQHLWRTDADHRLIEWRAPAGELQGCPIPGTPLAQWLEPLEGPDPLTALLARQAAVPPLRVGRTDLAGQPAWRLQAVALFDAEGAFRGHQGSLEPLSRQEAQAFSQAVLQGLWPALGLAVLVLKPQADGVSYDLVAASPHAQPLLGHGDGQQAPALPCPWDVACLHLPPELARAVADLQPGQSQDTDDWTASLRSLAGDTPGQEAGRLLLLLPRRAADAPTEGLTAADHESFVYTVSHDLRAPIRVVEGFARILKEDYGRFLDRIGNDHLDRVLSAAARMNSMIDALLALSRLQSQPLVRRPVDLSQLAGFVMEDLRREAPDRAATVRIEPDMVVSGDATLLRIALDNLLGNAWKYSGQVTQAEIEFRSERREGQRVYVVSDNGAGFDMRFADRLFGVFQRLHSPKEFQGTGVGLASVRRIVRRHGGDIWAESAPGQGARFYFTLG